MHKARVNNFHHTIPKRKLFWYFLCSYYQKLNPYLVFALAYRIVGGNVTEMWMKNKIWAAWNADGVSST